MCKGLFGRLCHWGPIGALVIIKWITLSASYCNTMWWPPENDIFGTINMTTLLILSVLTTYHFLSALFDGPGYVKLGWKPENEKEGKWLQFCDVCNGFKVPRSHHCRKCGRCVKKMDHHCPWINNCVGHANHGHFIGFLFFAVCGSLHAAVTLSMSLYYGLNRQWYHYYGTGNEPKINLTLFTLIAILFGLGLAIGVVLAVGALFYFQMSSAWRNQTGIEDWIMEKAAYRRRDQEKQFENPYKLGGRRNLLQVISLSCGRQGDGIKWKLKEGTGEYDMTVEQILQKHDKRERTREYKIVLPYSGSWFPLLSQGLRVTCRPPCTDEPRIPLLEGDVVRVTRWKKHWLYGDKVVPSGGSNGSASTVSDSVGKGADRIRGWFPRRCSMDFAELNHRMRQAAAKRKKDE